MSGIKSISAMLAVFLPVLIGLTQLSSAGEVNIRVTADPPLPISNMIQNSSFEEIVGGKTFWPGWNYYKGKGEVKIVADQAHSGQMSVCLAGFSDDAQGQIFTQAFYVPTDIPLLLDFWVKSDKVLPSGGTMSLRYLPDNKDGVSDGVDVQIPSLIKITEQWIQFSNPPPDIGAKLSILFWQPRTKDAPRTCQSFDKNIITFPKAKFWNQDKIKVRLFILSKGMGCLWYDDVVLKPLETRLKYTVSGVDVTEIKVCNKRKDVIEQKSFSNDWAGEYSGTVVVPSDDSYQVEVKTKSGEVKYAEYPVNAN